MAPAETVARLGPVGQCQQHRHRGSVWVGGLRGQFLLSWGGGGGAFSDPQTSTKMTGVSVELTFCSPAGESETNASGLVRSAFFSSKVIFVFL